MHLAEKTKVLVKSALMALLPAYLERRHTDVLALQAFLAAGDYEGIRSVGHKLRGNASTYGLHALSDIGAQLESAAKRGENSEISLIIGKMEQYLRSIEVCPS